MKKCFICLGLFVFLLGCDEALAHHCHYNYVTYRDYYQQEIPFHECTKHYELEETTIYYYSNGSRYTYVYSTILNSDGTVLESGCKDVRHFIQNGKHYFTFYKNKKYQIMDENGKLISTKNYKLMQEINKNKLLVKLNKKYGIIDLNDNAIIPIKYKSIKKVGDDLYLTNLNGYYGLLNSSNKVFIKSEFDKITSFHNIFKLKIDGKFGLANAKGEMILFPNCDSIKKLGEYILVKRGKEYGVFDADGTVVAEIKYRKIKFERNKLLLQNSDKTWETIE